MAERKTPNKPHVSSELIPAFFTSTLNRNTCKMRFLNYIWVLGVFFPPGINLIDEFHPEVRGKKKITQEDSQWGRLPKEVVQPSAWDFQVQTEESPEQPGLTP